MPYPRSRPARALLAALVVCLTAGLLALAPPASAQSADYQQVADLTFPTERATHFTDSYDAPRSGGRVHKATDIMGAKLTHLYAAVDGTVCYINGIDEPMSSWGYSLNICGTDGRTYHYLHINNDTPGTDDGAGGTEWAYAPGIRRGREVRRGQWLGYMGDSGNAESSGPHLHFEIFDERVTDPYGDTRIDPYGSLRAALARGDLSTDDSVALDPVDRVAGPDRIATGLAVGDRFETAETVVLAPATTFQDPVVAGPLAAALDAPLYTTFLDRLDERVGARISELGVSRAILVGGLDPAVAEALDALGVTEIERLTGADPFATSVAVADAVWEALGQTATDPTEAPEVPVATSTGFAARLLTGGAPDRSGARPLQDATLASKAPIWLEVETRAAIAEVAFRVDDPDGDREAVRVERERPYDLGGTGEGDRSRRVDVGALGAGVHSVTAVVRLEGGAEERLTSWFVVEGGSEPAALRREAVIALGDHPSPERAWPDGLTASYLGAAEGAPVLLVDPSVLPPVLRPALETVDAVTIVGGTSAVGRGVEDELAAAVGSVQRLAGETRFGTALAVSDHVLGDERPKGVYAATGYGWVDAIVAGPRVAHEGLPLVLVDGADGNADGATGSWLAERVESLESGLVIGGSAVVTDSALQRLARRLT